jgi:2-oxo-3-hexenedioate decarboxylase
MATRDELADRLVRAVRSRTSIGPLTTEHPDLSLEEAYRVQDLVVEALGGREAAKLGLTSKAKQQQMHVDSPLSAWLPPGSRLRPGEPLVVADLIQPRVEPEIAFVLGTDLSGPTTVAHVLAATERVVPALDVLDSRFEGYGFTLPDVIADNGSTGSTSGSSGACSSGTGRSWRPRPGQRCWGIRPPRWPGSPASWRPEGGPWRRGRRCWRDR